MQPRNLLSDIPAALPEELIETLIAQTIQGNPNPGQVRIERIISKGHCSQAGFWYDQDEAEFVYLIQGEAKLAYADPPKEVTLIAGDSLFIPAHVRHRVVSTQADLETIWLAVFFSTGSVEATLSKKD